MKRGSGFFLFCIVWITSGYHCGQMIDLQSRTVSPSCSVCPSFRPGTECGIGFSCADDSECCPGQACQFDPFSGTDLCCINGSSPCQADGDCCNLLSCTELSSLGTSLCCNTSGSLCQSPLDCCPGSVCNFGVCYTPSCFGLGHPCTTDEICCSTLKCTDNVCSLNSACQFPGMPCNDLFPCCSNVVCLNNTICCGLDSAPCIKDQDCCQNVTHQCFSGLCVRTNKTIVLDTPGSYTLNLGPDVTQLAVTLCEGGGSGAYAFTGYNAGGGGSGSCILKYPLSIPPNENLVITVGEGGGFTCEDCNGNSGASTVFSIPSLSLLLIAYGGGGGSLENGGGGAGGGGPGYADGEGGIPSSMFPVFGGKG